MNVLVYLVPMALGLGLAGLFAFIWSLKAGQYDDIEGAAIRILEDDDVDAEICNEQSSPNNTDLTRTAS